MMSITKLIAFFVLTSCIAAIQAAEMDPAGGSDHAGDVANAAANPTYKLGGFGTLGVSHSSQSMGDYVVDGTVPDGPGRSSEWSATNDSRIGLQATAVFTPQISAVLQVVSEYNPDGTYRPNVEWANVKYTFSSHTYIRVGRIALPTFLYSDSREVGYSFPWIHPPVDLYRQLSMTNSDGLDISYRTGLGDAGNYLRLIYGGGTIERPTSTSTAKNLWGVFDTLEYGPATLRVGYQQRNSSTYSDLTGITGEWIPTSDLTVGGSYDPGDWFVMSEWIQRKSTSELTAMYVSAGLRINKFTPYLTYSQNSPATFLSGFPAPTATAIQYAKKSQNTESIGVRWDFMKNTDAKLQYDQVHLSDDSNGYLANVPTGITLYGATFHVISAVLDFVF